MTDNIRFGHDTGHSSALIYVRYRPDPDTGRSRKRSLKLMEADVAVTEAGNAVLSSACLASTEGLGRTEGRWHGEAHAHDSGSNMNCLSSCEHRHPAAIFAAHASASRRVGTLSTQKPPLSLLVSR